jgi:dTDP-4-amino-4,6-dideoxygalactose transaminase
MNILFGDLKRHYQIHQNELDQAIRAVLNSGWFILGAQCQAFETAFSAYCGCVYGIGVGSGTEALHLGLVACGIKPGDEVITVSHTAVPTVSAISFAGATPVFVDIEPDTYTLDASLVSQAITPRTRAIVPVHLYGQAVAMRPILEIAQQYGLKVVEDCAQAHGAVYEGKKVGSWGDVGCFSFYPSKNLGAFGDGGMVVTQNPDVADRLRHLRNYGSIVRDRHDIEGFNSRLDELQAAMLSVKLGYLDAWNMRRREIAQYYRAHINHPRVVHPVEREDTTHVFHLYVIQVPNRDQVRNRLKAKGVGTGIHYPVPVHLQPAYAHLPHRPLPVTEHVAGRIISLPIYPELTDEEVAYVAQAVCEAVDE